MAKRLSKDRDAGSNQPGPNEFAEHWAEITAARRALNEAQGFYRSRLKLAKDAGFTPAVLTELIRLSKVDPEVIEAHNRELARLAAWANIPIGTQAGLFDDAGPVSQGAADAIREVDVKQAGYDAALRGEPSDQSPHSPGTRHAVVWRAGWDAGRDFMERSGKLSERTPSPRRRGRAAGGRRAAPDDGAEAGAPAH